MQNLFLTLVLACLVAFSGPVAAQEADPDAEAPTEETPAPTPDEVPDPMELNMGEEASTEAGEPGSIYIRSEHGDWQIRCFVTEDGNDPCQLYQLLTDPSGNPVSEINVFPVSSDNSDAAAGATVVTPLETLLTAQLGLQVDSSGVKKYPFSWCSEIGCFARLGFTQDDVAAFKRGNQAKIIIRPVAAPDQVVTLNVSLTGFTAAFDEAKSLQTQ